MSRPVLVFIKAHYIDGRIVHYFGDEMPPRLFAQEVINRLLDDGVLAEYDESNRRRYTGAFLRLAAARNKSN